MKVIVPFIGGVMHGIRCEMTRLPQLNLFFDERDKRVHAYLREEMAYFYEAGLSERLTVNYDMVRTHFPGFENKIIPVDD